ncbi:unnamed protein product [Dicrocoelium dendriticum]|nr:unnamed protein product [Dicrocoelium dendriticum]CAH8504110.1 unnamed protein product [Dicrocoelium dendriticum]
MSNIYILEFNIFRAELVHKEFRKSHPVNPVLAHSSNFKFDHVQQSGNQAAFILVQMVDATQIECEILDSIRPTITELVGIWDYVGYDEAERNDRLQATIQQLRSLLEEVIRNENTIRLEIEHEIEHKRRAVAELCQQLRIPSYLPDRGFSSNVLLKKLQEKYSELGSLRRTRCEEYTRLRTRIVQMSILLKEPPDIRARRLEKIPPLSTSGENGDGPLVPGTQSNDHHNLPDRVPDERELKSLNEIFTELNEVYAPLAAQHDALLEDIARISADIAYEPQTDREAEVLKSVGLATLCVKPTPASTPGVVRKVTEAENTVNGVDKLESPHKKSNGSYEPAVDSDTLQWLTSWRLKLVKEKARLVGTCEELRSHLSVMWRRLDKPMAEQTAILEKYSGYKPETLEALQEEVDRCQQVKWEKLDIYLSRLATEAARLARLCCMSEDVVQLPPGRDPNDPEVAANHLETVVEQLNQTYEMHKSIFDSIALYEEQWQSLAEVELRLKDPAIFSNRGGILLKTEKEKKRLLKEVQRTEQEALSAIEQYELKTKKKFTLSDGRSFKDYVQDRASNNRPTRESSRVRKSTVTSNSRPNSVNLSGPPGAPV